MSVRQTGVYTGIVLGAHAFHYIHLVYFGLLQYKICALTLHGYSSTKYNCFACVIQLKSK